MHITELTAAGCGRCAQNTQLKSQLAALNEKLNLQVTLHNNAAAELEPLMVRPPSPVMCWPLLTHRPWHKET